LFSLGSCCLEMRDSHQQINMPAISANLGKWQAFHSRAESRKKINKQANSILETIRAPNPANDDASPTKTYKNHHFDILLQRAQPNYVIFLGKLFIKISLVEDHLRLPGSSDLGAKHYRKTMKDLSLAANVRNGRSFPAMAHVFSGLQGHIG